MIIIRMEFFRKSGALYNLIILTGFLSFIRYPATGSIVKENIKKGSLIEFVQLNSGSAEYINPNTDRTNAQVLPLIKFFSEKPYPCDLRESGKNLSVLVRFSLLISLSASTCLEKICKLQI
jgi:hypothetical protein